MAAAEKHVPTTIGTAKACAHWEGSDATLDRNFNVASLTDSGAGLFSPVIGNDMSDANYAAPTNANVSQSALSCSGTDMHTPLTTQCDVNISSNKVYSDRDDTCISIFGGLA